MASQPPRTRVTAPSTSSTFRSSSSRVRRMSTADSSAWVDSGVPASARVAITACEPVSLGIDAVAK